MYCTYRSLNQMMKFKRKGVFQNPWNTFRCESNEIDSVDKLENEKLMSKYFGNK